MNPYLIQGALLGFATLGTLAHSISKRKHVDEMHGMMAGMTLGMISGLLLATIFVIPTGNFLWGVILGSMLGLLIGIPSGTLGGHLGVMEGIMAGPMGGMMGAMLGQMIRPYDIDIFMPFFTFIILLSLIATSYVMHRGCCDGKPKPPSNKMVYGWMIVSVLLLLASIALPFSLEEKRTQEPAETKLPPYLQQLNAPIEAKTTVADGKQSIDITITSSAYKPNVILAQKGIPLTINLHAEKTAGCAREFVVPSKNISVIVPLGGSKSVTIIPDADEIPFRCSMDMIKGVIKTK